MNLYNEIGGYFELELTKKEFQLENDVIALNCARNCLRYIIKVFNIKKMYVPYYTCPVVWQAIHKENCEIKFYHIDEKFIPTENFKKDAFILYTNYFGVCAKNIKDLSKKYKNIIIDNAQAFYMPKFGIASFNSLRKFFGIPDGAFLYCDKKLNMDFEQDKSYDRCSHLLQRVECPAEKAYELFNKNEKIFGTSQIKLMSKLTNKIFANINTEQVKKIRLNNFKFLAKKLNSTNELKINLDIDDVPMVYPYLIENKNLREKLIKSKIYIATYWNTLPEKIFESKFSKYLIPIPIDQRYNEDDMKKIIRIINE